MEDFRNIKLEVGDNVVYTSSSHLHKGLNQGIITEIVKRIGKERATIKGKNGWEVTVECKNIMKML